MTTDGTWTYSYDLEGNETAKSKTGEYWVYAYDNRNRLTHAEKRATSNGSATLTIDFKYDIWGNRIERDYDPDGAGATAATVLKMAYDQDGNAWADLDNSGSLTIRRLYGGVDNLIARIPASTGNEDWYLTDYLGSVRDIVNSSGTLIDHIDYNNFGLVTTETSPSNGDRYTFTGREREAELDLQYNRARYLDPKTMRWMSNDPIGFNAGDSNLYRYVSNNPVMGSDPSGLSEDHHIIVQALFETGRVNRLPFSDEAMQVFRSNENIIPNAPNHKGFTTPHPAYNRAVRLEVRAWLTANQIRPEAMTTEQARRLVQHISKSENEAISGFLRYIRGGTSSIRASTVVGFLGVALTACHGERSTPPRTI